MSSPKSQQPAVSVANECEARAPQPAKAAQDSPLVGLGKVAVALESELERVKGQLATAQMYLEAAEAQREKAEQLNSELLAALKDARTWALGRAPDAVVARYDRSIARAEEAQS